jgi:hypothetical protein
MPTASASIKLDHAQYVPKSACVAGRQTVSAQVSRPAVDCWRAGLIIRRAWIRIPSHSRSVAATSAALAKVVGQAVGLGIGWPEIAVRLGVTRQAARQHDWTRP